MSIEIRNDEELRKQAVARLRNQRDFRVHVTVYLAMNAGLVAIWAMTGTPFFWPAFPIFLWGIGVVAHAWDAYGNDEVSEDRIRREIERLRK